MKKWSWLLALVFLPVSAYSDGNNYGAASYLEQGVGGRANGMGDAYVAVVDDATSGYWNPAGLAQMGLYMYEVGAEYAFLPNDMSTSFLSYAFQWPEVGNFSLAWINFGIGNIEGRDAAGLVTNTFGSSENTLILSYGRKTYEWVKGLSLGANLKFLHQGLADYSAIGHGLDLGIQWQPFMYWDHTIGLNVQNLFQKLYWKDSTQDNSLVNAKLGFALKFMPSDEQLYYDHLVTAVDLEFSEYRRFKFHAGAEYWFINSLAVRAGVNGTNFTVGASFRPEYYQIDYAFIYDTSEIAAHQHRLSLELRLATNYEQTASQSSAVLSPLPEREVQPPLELAVTPQATPGIEPQAPSAPATAPTPAPTTVPTVAATPVVSGSAHAPNIEVTPQPIPAANPTRSLIMPPRENEINNRYDFGLQLGYTTVNLSAANSMLNSLADLMGETFLETLAAVVSSGTTTRSYGKAGSGVSLAGSAFYNLDANLAIGIKGIILAPGSLSSSVDGSGIYGEKLSFSQKLVSTLYAGLLGVNYRTPKTVNGFNGGVTLAAGPAAADETYTASETLTDPSGYIPPISQNNSGSWSGDGIYAELGVDADYSFSSLFAVFLGAGYHYCMINNMKNSNGPIKDLNGNQVAFNFSGLDLTGGVKIYY